MTLSRTRRIQITLASIAISGWIGALISHRRAVRTADDDVREGFATRRNQFLLLSSICMNSLVLSTAYWYVRQLRRGHD